MNWPVLKDKKWWVLVIISLALSIAAIILAANNNIYWVFIIILAQFISFFGVRRASYLTHEVHGKNQDIK